MAQNGRLNAPWSRGPRRGTRRARHRRSARREGAAGMKVSSVRPWSMEKSVGAILASSRARFPRGSVVAPDFSWEACSAEKKSSVRCRRTACGGRGSGPEAGRDGTHLVGELVGVTLVDRLGGEEEGGTVLGSHRSCWTSGREGRGRSATTIGGCALQPQGSGWTTLGGRRQGGVRRAPRRATRAFAPVSMALGTRGTAARVDRATARSNPPGRARFARPRRRSDVKIHRDRRFSKPRIRRAGEAPWPPRAREGRGRRPGRGRDALRARTLTFRKWVKV